MSIYLIEYGKNYRSTNNSEIKLSSYPSTTVMYYIPEYNYIKRKTPNNDSGSGFYNKYHHRLMER